MGRVSYCKGCGYCLLGLDAAGRCPECGRAFDRSDPRSYAPRPPGLRWRRTVGAAGCALGLALGIYGGVWAYYWLGWSRERAAGQLLWPEVYEVSSASVVPEWLSGVYPRAMQKVFRRSTEITVTRELPDQGLLESQWDALRAYTEVERIEVSSILVPDERVPVLASLPRLDGLFLTGTGTTGAGAQQLGVSRSIRRLRLRCCPVDDRGLAGIGAIRTLEELVLEDTPTGDDGLAALARLPRLRSLRLEGTRVGDRGLGHLAQSDSLEELYVDRAGITDRGVAHLLRLERLTSLALDRTLVTDAALPQLARLPLLRYLSVRGCPVSPSGVEAFRALRPDVKVGQGPIQDDHRFP